MDIWSIENGGAPSVPAPDEIAGMSQWCLRFRSVFVVGKWMDRRSTCCVGIDGLPLGTQVVVAVGGVVESSFGVSDAGGRPVDLDARVDLAIRRAAEATEVAVTDVRLVCFDDGADGRHLGRISDRLLTKGIGFQVLETVDSLDPGVEASTERSSLGRARGAALW